MKFVFRSECYSKSAPEGSYRWEDNTDRSHRRGEICAGPTYPVGVQDAVQHKDETVGRYSVVVFDAKAFRLGELPRRPSSLDPSCAHSKVRPEQPGGGERFRRSECLAGLKGNPCRSADITYNSSQLR